MLSIYAKLSSHLLAVRKRERAAAHEQGTVFTLARLYFQVSRTCITSNVSVLMN